MNPEIKEKWVAALRSGEYAQGVNRLRQPSADSDKFCCLDVLCELAVEANIIPKAVYSDISGHFFYGPAVAEDARDITLPDAVQEWADLRDEIGSFDNDALTDRNDGGATFSEIADIIEEKF